MVVGFQLLSKKNFELQNTSILECFIFENLYKSFYIKVLHTISIVKLSLIIDYESIHLTQSTYYQLYHCQSKKELLTKTKNRSSQIDILFTYPLIYSSKTLKSKDHKLTSKTSYKNGGT